MRGVTKPALQSAERRCKLFQAQCAAAVNQRHTAAIGQKREKVRLEFPVVSQRWHAA